LIKSPKQLSKFIFYMLGRRPDEFGLIIPDDGYVRIKDVLKAVSEEDGWKYVRRSHLEEIAITIADPPIEIKDNFIRATRRENLPGHAPVENPPKLLYTCVREKAYPVVLEKGIRPWNHPNVVLSSSRNMAERIGKRFDRKPVVLTVHTAKSAASGIRFHGAGEQLYLCGTIPPECFSGPPLPKPKPEPKKDPLSGAPRDHRGAGSFEIDPSGGFFPQKQGGRKTRRDKNKTAKERAIKQRRRRKRKMWEP
jgi:putative RNA 2'-phosphotransferase